MTRMILLHHGGKWGLAPKIISLFPEHKIYVEPFCGGSSVLLQKPRSEIEIINDRDDVIVNIFKALRDHPLEMLAKIWATPYAKSIHNKKSDDAMENAALAIAKAKQFYLGNQLTSTFSLDATTVPHKNKADVWSEWHERVLPAAARLKTVQILNEDAIAVIKRFSNNPEALIYIDPPYLGHEKEYRHTIDYAALIESCKDTKAKIIVSEFEEGALLWPSNWRRHAFKVTGRSAAGAHKKTKINSEIIILNFEDKEILEGTAI